MQATHDQLIGVYKNALSKEWCSDIIQIFEKNIDLSYTRQEQGKISGTLKKDRALNGEKVLPPEYIEYFTQICYNKIFPLYINQYPSFDQILEEPNELIDFKIQKTLPGEGYHAWHFETNNVLSFIERFLVWTIYLNDVEEGGETEFLYQSKRLAPTTGTLCLFPSYFTHTHRGNPPLSGVKYICTGWVRYTKLYTPEEIGLS